MLSLTAAMGCASRDRGFDVPASASPAQDMTLGPGDTFEIMVYEEKELSGKYRVGDDGTINFPLIGTVSVGGKGPTLVASTIQSALVEKQILRNPSVSVYVVEYASKRINVVGAVQHPGSLPWTAGMGVVQAISVAGGLTPLAAANDTIVTRQLAGQPKRYRVSVRRITEGQEGDFTLEAGDIVYVPERIF
ncbi:MAG TPA: polysaccharide biosynthesis/export family protein [Polyangiales bacterium]|jgi:polysaccharide export outer membrane protein|nr:polysaccharide biosynthesis/export family protein [Polyangiales bacterium]